MQEQKICNRFKSFSLKWTMGADKNFFLYFETFKAKSEIDGTQFIH